MKPRFLFVLVLTSVLFVNFSFSQNKVSQEIVLNDTIINKGCPVLFADDTLFVVYNNSGSFSAIERANAISQRIEKIAHNYTFYADSIKIIPSENTYDIVYGEIIIMSVSSKDAVIVKLQTQELAIKYKIALATSIEQYRQSTSVKTILIDIALILIVLFVAYWFVRLINKGFRFIKRIFIGWEGKHIKSITINTYEFISGRRLLKILLTINNLVRLLFIAFSIFLTLPIIFKILPWTKGIADTLWGFVFNPFKHLFFAVWHYLPNLFTIIVIVIIFNYLLKGLLYIKTEIETEKLKISGFYPDWANPTFQIIRVLIFAFMLVLIFPYLPGSNSPVFQGVSVFLGFLLTFGSAGSLSNVIAGLVLTYMRSFRIGDRVKIGDVTGDIIGKSLLVTRIRTIKNEDITIPNSTIMNNHTINYSSSAQNLGLIINTTVTIGYDVPWRDMHKALIDAALKTNFLLQEPIPFVLQTSLDDFYVSYQINAYTNESNKQALIYSELHQNIQDVCNERGIEILSPHYRQQRDGNATTIPANYLPPDYKSPSFNFRIEKTE